MTARDNLLAYATNTRHLNDDPATTLDDHARRVGQRIEQAAP